MRMKTVLLLLVTMVLVMTLSATVVQNNPVQHDNTLCYKASPLTGANLEAVFSSSETRSGMNYGFLPSQERQRMCDRDLPVTSINAGIAGLAQDITRIDQGILSNQIPFTPVYRSNAGVPGLAGTDTVPYDDAIMRGGLLYSSFRQTPLYGQMPVKQEMYYASYEPDNDVQPADNGTKHIPAKTDNMVVLYIIPLLAFITGLIFKRNTETLKGIYLKIWNIVKDIDNLFDNPNSSTARQYIASYDTLNAAKKAATIARIQEQFSVPEKDKLIRKHGSIAAAVEKAIWLGKMATGAFSLGKKLVNAIH